MADEDEMFIFSREDVEEIRRVLKWIKNLRGDGVTNTPWGATVGQVQSGRASSPTTSFRPPLVKITGDEAGGGKYTGVLWLRPTVDIPAAGNLTEAELGIENVDEDDSPIVIRVVNTREVGESTHDLDDSGYLPLIFPAVFLKVADDGVPVYMIDGRQSEPCS